MSINRHKALFAAIVTATLLMTACGTKEGKATDTEVAKTEKTLYSTLRDLYFPIPIGIRNTAKSTITMITIWSSTQILRYCL